MASQPPSHNFKIRVEGLESAENESIEFPYYIDLKSNFYNVREAIECYKRKQRPPGLNIFLTNLSLLFLNSELQIVECNNKVVINEGLENETFIPDPFDFEIVWDSNKYMVQNQGLKVIELFPDKKYLMIIRKRKLKPQRRDLLKSFGPKFEESRKSLINIYLEYITKSATVITTKFGFKISDFFPAELKHKKIELLYNDNFIEICPNSLLEGLLKKCEDTGNEYDFEFMNYMTFRITELQVNQLPSDECLLLSFDAILKSNGKKEKNRLKSCINMIDRVKISSAKSFFAPFLNVCQSSGSGKSKIATELMFEMASFYVVLREEVLDKETSERAQAGYPYMSKVSKLFLDVTFQMKDDSNALDDHPSDSTVGRYLLLLKVLFSDYLNNLKVLFENEGNNNNGLKYALKDLYHEIMNGNFMGGELKLFSSSPNWKKIYININNYKLTEIKDSNSVFLSMENIIKACKSHLLDIYALQKSASIDNPFVLIVDEASLLSSKSSDSGLNCFRLFRRAVNRLGRESKFVVLTLGTNSDVLDLNPELTFDSFRVLSVSGEVYAPFILSRNWDVLMDSEELHESPIGYNEMVMGRMMIFWFSLGRPLWSSINFSLLEDVIRIKITNNSIESGEAYLAFWMIRVGLLVNPTNVITHHLVKSLMATILHVSSDLRSMRVYYPSEPALAVGVRSILMESAHLEKYYSTLEKFIKARAIDTGRFSEIISADVCLLAIARAKDKKKQCYWDYNNKLPKVCKVNGFILESSEFHTLESREKIDKLVSTVDQSSKNDNLRKLFEDSYIIMDGKVFIESLYGSASNMFTSFIPELIKTALLNMTHYTQVSNYFPFEALKTESGAKLQANVPPLVDSKRSRGFCNQITFEILESMIIRGSGIMLAPGTFGLDHVIPICFKPLESSVSTASAAETIDSGSANNNKSANGPEYSFIGVQVKRGAGENIRTIMAKGAVSNHYVRCGLHGMSCFVSGEECKHRVPYVCFRRILENGFMLIHSLTDNETNLSDEETDVSDGHDEKEAEYGDISIEIFNAHAPKQDPKRLKFDPENYKVLCETSLPETNESLQKLEELKTKMKNDQINEEEFETLKGNIEENLRNIIRDKCPTEFSDKIKRFEFARIKSTHYENCRFIPDIYLSFNISRQLSLHCMIKKRSDGIDEKLVAIYSKGLEVFSNVLPINARNTARRIIFDDHSIFDEVNYDRNQDPPIKYTELVTGVVSRNNGSAIPIANNFIRSKYGLPPIPDNIPDYLNIGPHNIKTML
jgi:hypothetical protein